MSEIVERLASLNHEQPVRLHIGDVSVEGRLRGRLVTSTLLLVTVSERDSDRQFVIQTKHEDGWLGPHVDAYDGSSSRQGYQPLGTLRDLKPLG